MSTGGPGLAAAATGPGCEALGDGLLAEPVSAWTSLAFVVAGVVLLVARRTGRGGPLPFAWLVVGIGVGSVVQHGPAPTWADLPHDLPLLGTLALVAADAVAALTGRLRRWWWWVGPTVALTPVLLAAPRVGDAAQVAVAGVAVVLALVRAAREPGVRRRLLTAVALLALGGTIGTLSRAGGPLCDPTSMLQGHAVWHVLAAAALVVLGPALTAHPDARGPVRRT